MASEAANAAAFTRFPGAESPTPSSATKALRDAYAAGYDAGRSSASSDAAWAIDYDRQGGI